MAILAQKPFVAEYSTTTGDGPLTLGGRIGNYRTFTEAGIVDTNIVFADIRLISGGVTTEFEAGLYTYGVAGETRTLTAITPLSDSSNGGSKVSWSAGTKQIALALPPWLFISDNKLFINDPDDWSKRGRFDAGLLTADNRVWQLPDHNGVLATVAGAQALSNKSYSGSTLELTGRARAANFVSGTVTLADDAAATITPPTPSGLLVVDVFGGLSASSHLTMAYRVGSPTSFLEHAKGSSVTTGGGALFGTTGADNRLNFGLGSSLLYIENRLGSSLTVFYTFIGGPAS